MVSSLPGRLGRAYLAPILRCSSAIPVSTLLRPSPLCFPAVDLASKCQSKSRRQLAPALPSVRSSSGACFPALWAGGRGAPSSPLLLCSGPCPFGPSGNLLQQRRVSLLFLQPLLAGSFLPGEEHSTDIALRKEPCVHPPWCPVPSSGTDLSPAAPAPLPCAPPL